MTGVVVRAEGTYYAINITDGPLDGYNAFISYGDIGSQEHLLQDALKENEEEMFKEGDNVKFVFHSDIIRGINAQNI